MHVIQEVDPNFQRTVSLPVIPKLHYHTAVVGGSHIVLQVVVASKFDNRLKEFAERCEVDRYLSATGYLHPNAKPFFVALPKVQYAPSLTQQSCKLSGSTVATADDNAFLQDRSLTASSEWRQAIQQVDSAVLSHLRTEVAGGFDEEQFGNRIGFANLKM